MGFCGNSVCFEQGANRQSRTFVRYVPLNLTPRRLHMTWRVTSTTKAITESATNSRFVFSFCDIETVWHSCAKYTHTHTLTHTTTYAMYHLDRGRPKKLLPRQRLTVMPGTTKRKKPGTFGRCGMPSIMKRHDMALANILLLHLTLSCYPLTTAVDGFDFGMVWYW